ncbi:MAG: outer membrane beta-barrel protein [Bacteroidales bacterium]
MKKIALILVLMVGISSFSFAEDDKNHSAGDISVEVNFVPLSATPIQLNFLKGRFFLSDNMAVRLGFMFDISTISDTQHDPDDINNIEKETDRITDFGLTPGIEIHFPLGNRVSPYVGAELGFSTRSTKYEYSTNFNNDNITQTGIGGFTQFGLNMLVGTDVAIYKGLYLGAEFGFGFSTTSFPDVVTTATTGGVTVTETIVDNSSVFSLGTVVNPAIRLGWTF